MFQLRKEGSAYRHARKASRTGVVAHIFHIVYLTVNRKEVKTLEFELKDTNLSHMTEFEARMDVLNKLDYIDEYKQPTLKGEIPTIINYNV